MGAYTNYCDKFAYHVEDIIHCRDCLYYKNKPLRRNKATGCGEDMCRYVDLLIEALLLGNIKRKRGHFRCPE